MADEKPLKPEDFPVRAKQKNIVNNDGKPLAEACDKKTAEDIADRLNADDARNEEDRWA